MLPVQNVIIFVMNYGLQSLFWIGITLYLTIVLINKHQVKLNQQKNDAADDHAHWCLILTLYGYSYVFYGQIKPPTTSIDDKFIIFIYSLLTIMYFLFFQKQFKCKPVLHSNFSATIISVRQSEMAHPLPLELLG